MKEQATGSTSVRNYHYSQLNSPEESRSRVVLVTLSEMNGLPYDLMCTAVRCRLPSTPLCQSHHWGEGKLCGTVSKYYVTIIKAN